MGRAASGRGSARSIWCAAPISRSRSATPSSLIHRGTSSVFDNVLEPGRRGMADGRAGVRARPVEGLAIATVAAGGKRIAAVVETLERRFGVTPSAHPAYRERDGIGLVGTGPGRW